MHFAFILRCKLPDGKICHLAWQRLASTRKEVEKHVRDAFGKDRNGCPVDTELVELIEAGECKEGYENSIQLYEDACSKVLKLNAKAGKPAKEPVKAEAVAEKAA